MKPTSLDQAMLQNLLDAEAKRFLAGVKKRLLTGGCQVADSGEDSTDGRSYHLWIETNAGKGAQLCFNDIPTANTRLSFVESGYTEGLYDWASGTYIKPIIWARFKA